MDFCRAFSPLSESYSGSGRRTHVLLGCRCQDPGRRGGPPCVKCWNPKSSPRVRRLREVSGGGDTFGEVFVFPFSVFVGLFSEGVHWTEEGRD